MENLIRITSSYFCAGIIYSDGKVITTAPILSYMRSWTKRQVIDYCKKKKFIVEKIK